MFVFFVLISVNYSTGRLGALRSSLHRFHGGRRPPDAHVRRHLLIPWKCEEPKRKGELLHFQRMKEGSISTLFHSQPEQMATTCLVAARKWRPTAGDVISSVTTLRKVSQCCVSCHTCKWSEVPTECEEAEQRKVNHGWAKKSFKQCCVVCPNCTEKCFQNVQTVLTALKRLQT